MAWKKTIIDLGRIKEGSTSHFVFQEVNPTLKVKSVTPGCKKCTVIRYKDGMLDVVYKATKISKQLIAKGKKEQPTTNNITVVYEDDSKEVLKFTAIKVK